VNFRAAVEGHETEIVRLCSDSDGARRKLDQMKRDLDEEEKGRKSAEAKLGVAETAAIDRQAQIDNLASELEASRVKLEEQERHLVNLSTQLDQANRDKSRAEEQLDSTSSGHSTLIATLQSEVDGLKTDLRQKEEALATVSRSYEGVKAAHARAEDEAATLKTERVQIETALADDFKALQVRLDASALEVSELKADLEAAKSARDELQSRYDSISRDTAGTLQDATNQVALLHKKLETTSSYVVDLEKRLSSSESGREEAEKRFKDLMAGGDQKDIALKEAHGHVTVLQRKYDEQGVLLSTTKLDLDSRIAALANVENVSKSTLDDNKKLSAKVNTLVEELNHQKMVLRDTQAQFDKVRTDLAAANAASKKLSEDLASARAEAATRPRHASTPTGSHTGTAVLDNLRIQALKSASTGGAVITDKLRTKEKGEIERLEKVIEAQKEVIDDQREKIKFWAKVCVFMRVF